MDDQSLQIIDSSVTTIQNERLSKPINRMKKRGAVISSSIPNTTTPNISDDNDNDNVSTAIKNSRRRSSGRRISVFDNHGEDDYYASNRSPIQNNNGSHKRVSIAFAPEVDRFEENKELSHVKDSSTKMTTTSTFHMNKTGRNISISFNNSLHRMSSLSHRASMGMTVSFAHMLYGHGKVAAQHIELARSRERYCIPVMGRVLTLM